MTYTVKAKIISLCGLFLLVLIPLTLFLLWSLGNIVEGFQLTLLKTSNTIKEAQLLQKLVVDMETGQRGFIITGQEEFLTPYHDARQEFTDVMAAMRLEMQGQPELMNTLASIDTLKSQWVGFAGEPEIRLRRLVGATEINLQAIDQIIREGTGKRLMDEIRAVVEDLRAEFRQNDQKDQLILLSQIIKAVVDSETGQRGFLLAGNDRFLEPYYKGQVA